MGILGEIESMKYRFVLDLIKNTEHYDKKRSVITAEEAFKLCYNRYLLMQKILMPLKRKLGERVDVTDISFANGNQDETNMIIKYNKEDKSYILALSNIGDEEINILSSGFVEQQEQFVDTNRRIILNTFDGVSKNSLDKDFIVKSTSGKFIVCDNCDKFTIKDSEGKVFSIEGKYSTYEKNGSLFDPSKINCNYPKLKELLSDCWNGLSLYQHLQIYDDVFPKELTKKLPNR